MSEEMKAGTKPTYTRKDILDAALELTYGSRNKQYGSPKKNLEIAANLLSSYLETNIEPHQVAIIMMLCKISRLAVNPDHTDSYVDMSAYAAIAAEVRELQVTGEPLA